MAVSDVLLKQGNLRGAGVCFMILAIKMAEKCIIESYNRIIEYMKQSEFYQLEVIKQGEDWLKNIDKQSKERNRDHD